MDTPTPFGDPIDDRTTTSPTGCVSGSEYTTDRAKEPPPEPQGDVMGSAEFLQRFFEPHECIELRAFGTRNDTLVIEAGCTPAICQFVARNLARFGNTIAFKVNPVQPHLAQEAAHAPVTRSGVERITDLYIDLDPERESGMATPEERALAVDRAKGVRARLRENGFSDPVVVDSGNGIHLHYRVDLSVEDEYLTRGVLRRLHSEFSDDAVKIDTAVADASRLARLPGTVNRKGAHTAELPWKACTVLDAPSTRELTPRSVLEDFAGNYAQARTTTAHPTKATTSTPGNANAELIELQCGFMRDCRDHPESLNYSKWLAQLRILGRCQDAERLAHERSSGHPDYDWRETQAMIEDSIRIDSPHRCKTIQQLHGDEHCRGCPYNGNITSPIQLGYDSSVTSRRHKPDEIKPYMRQCGRIVSTKKGEAWTRKCGQDEVAQMYLASVRADRGLGETDPVLVRHNGAWLQYTGVFWERLTDEEFTAGVTKWGNAIPSGYKHDHESGEVSLEYEALTTSQARELAHQLKAAVQHPKGTNTWLVDNGGPLDPKYLHSFSNGLLDLQTGALQGHDPNFFCTYASDVEFDPKAPEPITWLECLDRQLSKGAQRELQKVFWYYLTGDMRYHVLAMIWGDPRSFKSMIGKVLNALLGDTQCAGVELEQLEKDFGMTSFADVKAAVFDDIKMEDRKSYKRAISRLLSLAAHGKIQVEQKYVNQDQGRKLSCHLMLISNDFLDFEDERGAMEARLLLFNTRESFVGREDHDLEHKVMAELPGILNWALAGRELLEQDNGFKQTPEGEQKLNERHRIRNPSMGFFRECLEVTGGPELIVKQELYELFQRYTNRHGLRHIAGNAFFQTIKPHIESAGGRDTKPTRGGKRTPCYEGVGVKDLDWLEEAADTSQESGHVRASGE